jgi:hypothetical protein
MMGIREWAAKEFLLACVGLKKNSIAGANVKNRIDATD